MPQANLSSGRPLTSASIVRGSASDENYLSEVGGRVRALRNARGITRRELAARSGVSERYLAQLEGGDGNISIRLMRRIAHALECDVGELVAERAMSLELKLLVDALAELAPDRLARARAVVYEELDRHDAVRQKRIALIGLRGAGKSTLGMRLAEALSVPFIELDREIEREIGAPIADVLTLWGVNSYREAERRVLDRILRQYVRVVIEASGGVVADPASWGLLRQGCTTVWVKASAHEHIERLSADSEFQFSRGREQALAELKSILTERDNLFRQADVTLDTSGRSVDESFSQLSDLVRATRALLPSG